MATLLRFALSAALVCAALAAVPTFPQSYTVHEHDSLGVYQVRRRRTLARPRARSRPARSVSLTHCAARALVQGVYVITADAYCCPPESPQCKVQTQDESGMK
jgi:hypothetical protein